jgi:hypothetical protein
MGDKINIKSETWVESQPQEMVGFAWQCRMCDAEQHRVYSYDSVEQTSNAHLRQAHSIREEDFEDSYS